MTGQGGRRLNDDDPSGTPVFVVNDLGRVWRTKTRSMPWALGCGTKVVLLEGKSGGYDVERCTVDETEVKP